MAAHNRRLKLVTFELGATQFQTQLMSWNLNNNSDDGDKRYTFAPDGEFREEVDPDYSLDLGFYSDWRSDGISDYLWENDGETVTFTIDHHPDRPTEHVRWTGECVIKAPTVGGEARDTETTEASLQIIGKPAYTRVA